VVHHKSGELFLHSISQQSNEVSTMATACILLDVRLGNMSGLEVFDQLNSKHSNLTKPVIFLTGHGDLHMAVDVLKKGAFDFVTKPFISEVLLEQLNRGLIESARRIDELIFQLDTKLRLEQLTDRERLIMTYVIESLHNKEIAELLGNSVRTIEIHRANMFDKMKVKSAIELARLMERYAIYK
jgi:two-component system response regulator DctR